MSVITLAEMEVKHIAHAARLHQKELPDDFCSRLGLPFLETVFYPYFLSHKERTGFVALCNDEVVGFIISCSPTNYYRTMIRQNSLSFLRSLALSILKQPYMIYYTIEVLLILFGESGYDFKDDDAELLYIAVSNAYHGQGIGSKLIRKVLPSLYKHGYKQCVAKTLIKTKNTNTFYIRNGFSRIHKAHGRVWYGIPTNK